VVALDAESYRSLLAWPDPFYVFYHRVDCSSVDLEIVYLGDRTPFFVDCSGGKLRRQQNRPLPSFCFEQISQPDRGPSLIFSRRFRLNLVNSLTYPDIVLLLDMLVWILQTYITMFSFNVGNFSEGNGGIDHRRFKLGDWPIVAYSIRWVKGVVRSTVVFTEFSLIDWVVFLQILKRSTLYLKSLFRRQTRLQVGWIYMLVQVFVAPEVGLGGLWFFWFFINGLVLVL